MKDFFDTVPQSAHDCAPSNFFARLRGGPFPIMAFRRIIAVPFNVFLVLDVCAKTNAPKLKIHEHL